jgi:hypothetical protein
MAMQHYRARTARTAGAPGVAVFSRSMDRSYGPRHFCVRSIDREAVVEMRYSSRVSADPLIRPTTTFQ